MLTCRQCKLALDPEPVHSHEIMCKCDVDGRHHHLDSECWFDVAVRRRDLQSGTLATKPLKIPGVGKDYLNPGPPAAEDAREPMVWDKKLKGN
jgi:hypothetical protein